MRLLLVSYCIWWAPGYNSHTFDYKWSYILFISRVLFFNWKYFKLNRIYCLFVIKIDWIVEFILMKCRDLTLYFEFFLIRVVGYLIGIKVIILINLWIILIDFLYIMWIIIGYI